MLPGSRVKWKGVALISTSLLVLISVVVGVFIYKRVTGWTPISRLDTKGKEVERIVTLEPNGGRVSWSTDGRIIAYDSAGDDGYFDIWTMTADGSDSTCLTCNSSQVSGKNAGNPAWHPSGDYLVFQAQDPSLTFSSYYEGIEDSVATPGLGINNNIWIMDTEGANYWQISDIESRYGVLHPHFSHDGTMLQWSEIVQINTGEQIGGYWAIKLADIDFVDGEPEISNIQTFTPGDQSFYETHGFSHDDNEILYSAYPKGEYFFSLEIYMLNLNSMEVTQLTDNTEWDEHAHFSPDGTKIIWSSSADIEQEKSYTLRELLQNALSLDLWIMNADGSEKRRLTYCNEKKAPEYIRSSRGVGFGDGSWNPDGAEYAVKLRPGFGEEVVVKITL